MATGAVIARILTQYSDKGSKAAQRDIANLGKKFDAYSKRAVKAFGLVAGAATLAAVKIGKDAVMAASDVSQQFGALDAVFGKNASQLKDFSKSMVDYGLSTADAARYAALLGTQLKGLGLSEQDAIDRTKQLEILASDLAATYGGTTADAVQALSSTFKGEYNPIERYGVAIKKSDITAIVAAKGLGKLKGGLLKAAEAQSAFELIISKTTAAQGQSRREYNTLAAQLQRLDASYTNIKASLGTALLPVVEKFADYLLKEILPGIERWVELNKDDLAASLTTAAKEAVKLLKLMFGIANWITNNIELVKNLAIAFASIWAVGKVIAFATAINKVTTAMLGLKAASGFLGLGAAGPLTKAAAKKGPLATLGVALAAGAVGNNLGYKLAEAIPGTTAYKAKVAKDNAKKQDKLMSSNNPMSPSPSDLLNGKFSASSSSIAVSKEIQAIIDETARLEKLMNEANADAKKKELSAVQKMYNLKLKELGLVETTADIEKMATANAIKANLARQAKLSGSSTIAIGAAGSKAFGTKGSTTVVVNNAGSVISGNDLVTSIVNGIERTTRRSFGSVGAFDSR